MVQTIFNYNYDGYNIQDHAVNCIKRPIADA